MISTIDDQGKQTSYSISYYDIKSSYFKRHFSRLGIAQARLKSHRDRTEVRNTPNRGRGYCPRGLRYPLDGCLISFGNHPALDLSKRVINHLQNKNRADQIQSARMERVARIELVALGLGSRCSTTELHPQKG